MRYVPGDREGTVNPWDPAMAKVTCPVTSLVHVTVAYTGSPVSESTTLPRMSPSVVCARIETRHSAQTNAANESGHFKRISI